MLDHFGDAKALEYRDAVLDPVLIAMMPDHFSIENASSWLNTDSFATWVAQEMQRNAPMSPSKSSAAGSRDASRAPSMKTPSSRLSSRAPSSTPFRTTPKVQRFATPVEISDDSEDDLATVATPSKRTLPQLNLKAEPDEAAISLRRKSKAKREIIEVSSDEGDDVAPLRKKARPTAARKPRGAVQITRQLTCDKLIHLTELPTCWTIPVDGLRTAYFLDLTKDTRKWATDDGESMSMATIIKSQDQDAWGGTGSGGSIGRASVVMALDSVKCQRARHSCQGIYHCNQLDMSLLDGCERYVPDPNQRRDLWEAERKINEQEGSTVIAKVAMFYKEVQKKRCPHVSNGGVQCAGLPVIRNLKEISNDGKRHFIGCSKWSRSDPAYQHRFVSIPIDVHEGHLRHLFQNKGAFVDDGSLAEQLRVHSGKCGNVQLPRNGGRGKQECAFTHINEQGQIVQGKLIQRACKATITIYFPVDRADRRAIVLLEGPHNHPMPASTKVSWDGKALYKNAVEAVGVTGATVVKVDSAQSTSNIVGGSDPSACDPALSRARAKRKIIQKVKATVAPHGNSVIGVQHRMLTDRESLPKEDLYIHKVDVDHTTVVVTMLPALAARIHSAKYSLHDNTYKRLHGDWKEWEVVIWDDRLNMRLTIARIYCQNETRDAYRRMWSGLWNTIGAVTGEEVKFKFMHGTGLRAILVDGNKPQAEACGDDLLSRNNPDISKYHGRDAMEILPFILRTCYIHFDRFLTKLSNAVDDATMKRVRGCIFLETAEELDAFKKFCEESPHKMLRDWYSDKKHCSWFFPSLNQFFSKMSEEDWFLTPGHTNLNESAHPFTNQHTGINLSLLEGIERAPSGKSLLLYRRKIF
ncbi:hypothetical protein PLICRDRAFT_179640 [Plicaturopsis crispa FD-325 SS-3]|uniref:Unplaced genomic scaffold PLICRscaffold_18, whole genome shotgun sequence n=1 Tax=Plicaturopsis crispa FD-325 SS-3 TaxID=944288 RepID=A0A0C9T888_PLICR|nr:hypothetical protein PLICRDRAFT_179640 [Plicaturopsis crispa FD-325 SS-3]